VTNAKAYADLNSSDGVSRIDEVCGEDRLGWLPACSSDPDNLTACLGQNPVNTSGWVKVRTSTERSSGTGDSRFILPPVFAQTLASNVAGTSVGACARVAWGTPPTTFAFTVCENIFNEYTNNGTRFAPGPPSTSVSSYEHRFIQRPGPYTGFCDESRGSGTWPLNSDFGWEDRSFGDVNCNVDMSTPSDSEQLLPDEPPYTPDTCYDGLVAARNSRQPIPVLVVRPIGGIWVEVVGTAAFVVTGYRVQSRTAARSWVRPFRRSCPADPAVCVIGYFTTQVLSNEQVLYRDTSIYGAFGAAPSLGASVVQTVG
jgi:hypothetical protein